MEIHNPAGDTAVSSKRWRRRGKKATSQTVDRMDANLEASKIRGDCEIANNNLEMDLLETVSTVQLQVGHPTMDGGLTEDSSRGKNKKRRKRIKKTPINDEVQSMDQANSMPNVRLTDKNLRQGTDVGVTENEGGQSTNQNKVDIKSTVSLAEGNVNAKRKRKRKKVKSKAGNNNEVESRDQSNSLSFLQLSDKSLRQEIDDKLTKNEGVQHANQDMIDIEPVNLTEGNVNQSMGQSHSMSKSQPSDKNFRQENCDKLAENVDVQHTDQNKVDIESTLNPTDGTVSAKRKRKKKRIKKKTGTKVELQSNVNQSMGQSHSMPKLQPSDKKFRQEKCDKLAENVDVQHTDQNKVDIESTLNPTEGNVSAKRKRKKKRIKKKTGTKVELQSNVNQSMGQSHSMPKLQPSDKNFRQENCDKLAENVDVQHTDQNKVDIESTLNPTEGNVSAKRKRKKKRIKKKTGTKVELQSMDQSNLQSHNSLRQEIDDKVTENEDVHIDEKKMDVESTYNLAEGNMSTKRKGRKKAKSKSKDKNKDEVQSMDLANDISNLQLSKNNIGREIDCKLIENDRTAQESDFPARKEYIPCHSDVKFENVLNKVNNGIPVVEGTTSLGPLGVKEAEFLSKDLGEYPRRPPTTTDRRKLLVLDVNGLLAYIVMPAPKGRKADKNILRRAVFKRPFCDDFLKFCFQNFDVGIWSSRAKEVIDRVVDYLLGNLKQKLLFCWNMSHSTQTGFKTLENIHKPLVCKELRKIWENDGSKFSWNKGQYNESNTLMIDDSPYKALLNPLHTAIFPHSYHYEDKDDNSLGPGGDLRVYLEGLLKSENVQEYVEHHPFGQSAINETNVSWQFYSGVLQTMSNKTHARRKPTPVLTLSQNLTAPPGDKVVDLEHSGIAHSAAAPIKQ